MDLPKKRKKKKKKKCKLLLLRMLERDDDLFNYARVVGKYAVFVATLFVGKLGENQRNEEELVKNSVFWLPGRVLATYRIAGRHQRVKLKR